MSTHHALDFDEPVFSIILPTRNRPSTFARAISSIANQTFKRFEVIAIDDCSTTNSYVKNICEEANIRYQTINNSSNLGAAGSRNAGIAIAKGKYISFLDDDDEYFDSFLQSTYDTLEGTSDEIGFSWCSPNFIDYPSNENDPLISRTQIFATQYSSSAELFEQVFSIGLGYGVTIKAHCIHQVGVFNDGFKAVEDTDMFLRILTAGFSPKIVSGVHIKVHNHHNFRLTALGLHSQRIMETEKILALHSGFFSQYPVINTKVKNHCDFLRNQMETGDSFCLSR